MSNEDKNILNDFLNKQQAVDDFEKEALDILARTGQGSLRDTLTLLDQAIIFSKGRVNTTSVVDMLGLIDPKLMDNIFSIIFQPNPRNRLQHGAVYRLHYYKHFLTFQ